jgi:hypothetical protein
MNATLRVAAVTALCSAGLLGLNRDDEITVSGFSTGEVKGVPELSFRGNDFKVTTENGVASFTADNSIGAFSLAAGSPAASSGTFTLTLNVMGGDSQLAARTLTALVSPDAQGGLTIHFTNRAAKLAFDSSTRRGSFKVALSDLTVEPGRTAPLLAVLSGSQQMGSCHLNFTAARAAPAVLSTLNQEMTPVLIRPAASDGASCAMACRIESVSSNEFAGANGDWQVTGDLTLKVRAARLSDTRGRIYSVAVRCTDNAGNTALQNAPIIVPLSSGR